MHVLEVRNAELMESLTKQAAELGITYAAIVASSTTISCAKSTSARINPRDDVGRATVGPPISLIGRVAAVARVRV